ncbi:hypothetical protein [Streptomyces sp. NPDC015130]|uniref:hypothetical protein n=1 Tax=Streptomyces sp. NPDC015130 TaxID=3364940 RepID=UPI0036F66BA1
MKVLLEHGQLEVVIRAAVERGDWVCAQESVRELCAAGEFERAEGVMAPFVALGWRPAVWETARILVRAGQVKQCSRCFSWRCPPRKDGWQVTDFADVGRPSLAKLVQQTGTPAVVAFFLDSDVGFIEALTPDGMSWEGLLNRRLATSYEIPLEQFPVEPAVAGAVAWSAAAGLTPDEEAIRQTLAGSALFAEELFSALLVALGLPGAT